MPSMRSELMTHESYKKMSIEALLEPDPEGWSVMEVDTLESMILYNNGEGKSGCEYSYRFLFSKPQSRGFKRQILMEMVRSI